CSGLHVGEQAVPNGWRTNPRTEGVSRRAIRVRIPARPQVQINKNHPREQDMTAGNMRRLIAGILACTFALGMGSAFAADVRSAIKEANAKMTSAFSQGDAAAVAALYASEAEVMPVGSDPG